MGPPRPLLSGFAAHGPGQRPPGDHRRARHHDRLVRSQGVKDAGLLDNEQYELGTRWAVYSGVFRTDEEAEARVEELRQLGIRESFVKSVKQAD